MSRKGTGSSGNDPYVKHVEVRPCGAAQANGAPRVNIAGYDFELIDAVQPHRRDLPPIENAGSSDVRAGFDDPDRGVNRGRALVRQSARFESAPTFHGDHHDDADDGAPSHGQGGMDLATVHRLLRGKYIWAILLGGLLSAAGIYAGIKLGYKTFQSTGLITVVPVTYIYDTPEKRNTSSQELVKALAAKITTQRVLDSAMDSPEWRKLGDARTDESEAKFAKNLQVTQEGQLLIVKFTDYDAEVATAAVKATMAAFCKQFDADQEANSHTAEVAVQKSRIQLLQDLSYCRDAIARNADKYGPEGLSSQRVYLLDQLHRTETQLEEISDATAMGVANSSVQASDRILQRLEDERFSQKSQIAQMEAAGVGANMRQRTSAEAMLANLEHQIEERKHELAGGPTTAPANGADTPTESLAARKTRLTARLGQVNTQLDDLTKKIVEVEKLKVQESHILLDLQTADESIHQRKVEDRAFRLDQSDPDRPLTSYRDTRIAFSIGGGLGGIIMGFGLMALLGLMDHRVLDPNDTIKGGRRYPVLGVLPQLPEDLADPEQVAVAAQGVHEVRNRLQLAGSENSSQQVFAITGAAAGSGKTSLTLGLGLSFASAGCNTLIIDGDLVGGGLSSRINSIVRRKIGQVLLREGLVTVEQLQEALTQGQASGRRVGEMLVQLGYVAEADLLAAVERQGRDSVGLLDAIGGEDLGDCTIATGITNLTTLPLGGATAAHAGLISGAAMGRLIDRARQHFDVIVIDTGPIPGSIEASIAAANADTVVLVVARGDTQPDVERSLSYLRQLPVRFAGLVFNRARKRDIERYGSSRVSNSNSHNPDMDVPSVELPGSMRFGPIPQSVVSRVPRNPSSGFRPS